MPTPSQASPQVAERLYYKSPELTFNATVTDIRLVTVEKTAGDASSKSAPPASTQVWQVALDRTAFYPEGGGQPFDTGVLLATSRGGATLEVEVENVQEDEAGEVWHTVRKPLVEGTAVAGRVNRARRLEHMQQHSGQHLLSAVFLLELEARTVSFHLGEDSSTIDLALPGGMEPLPGGMERLTTEQLRRVERRTNELVAENRFMRADFVSREEAEAMLARGELRKLPERSGPMRLVEIEGIEFNACGGTHVGATGAIGSVLLRRVEKVRQGFRVEFVCGLRAVRTAARDYSLVADISAAFSTSPSDVPARLAALSEENKLAAKAQKALQEELAESLARELAASAEPPSNASPTVVQGIFDRKDIDFAKRVASALARSGHSAIIGVRNGEAGAVALSLSGAPGLHAGNLLREVLSAAGARGGGSVAMAQGMCSAILVERLIAALVERLHAPEVRNLASTQH